MSAARITPLVPCLKAVNFTVTSWIGCLSNYSKKLLPGTLKTLILRKA